MNNFGLNLKTLFICLVVVQVFVIFFKCSRVGRIISAVFKIIFATLKLDYILLCKTYKFLNKQIAKYKGKPSKRHSEKQTPEKKVVNGNVIDINTRRPIKEGN